MKRRLIICLLVLVAVCFPVSAAILLYRSGDASPVVQSEVSASSADVLAQLSPQITGAYYAHVSYVVSNVTPADSGNVGTVTMTYPDLSAAYMQAASTMDLSAVTDEAFFSAIAEHMDTAYKTATFEAPVMQVDGVWTPCPGEAQLQVSYDELDCFFQTVLSESAAVPTVLTASKEE